MEGTDVVVFRDVWIIIMDILCPKYLRKEAVIRSTELIPLFNLACTSKNFNEFVTQRLHDIRERNIVRMSSQQSVCSYLALNGWLSLLQAAVTRGYKMDKDTMDCAAVSGSLDCLKYARKCGCAWDAETTALAASNSTECLIYLHQNGCPWDERASEAAALSGSLERLQYIRTNRGPWNSKTCANAATISLECLQYAHQNGCLWSQKTLLEAARCNQLSCLQYAFERGCTRSNKLCEVAAENGAIECLKYLHAHGCSFSAKTCLKALLSHNFECLVYVVENGCHVPESILEDAAFEHDEQAIKYLLSKGCKWISSRHGSVCNALAVADDVIGLQLAHLHGCPLVESMMPLAANYGSLKAAKFGLAHGFKLNIQFMENAMICNEFELVKLAHENGAPWPQKMQCVYLKRPNILKYAYENGCYLPKYIVKDLLSRSQIDSAIYCLEQGALWSKGNIQPRMMSRAVCKKAFVKFARAKFPAQEITTEQDNQNERQEIF